MSFALPVSPIRLARAMLVIVALGAAAGAAAAQSADEQSAYVALLYTPVGGLPPLPPVSDSLARKSGVSLLGRLGHTSRGEGALTLTSYALSVEVPRGRMRLGATLGYLSASCGVEWQGGDDDCAGDIMIGGSMRSMITNRSLSGNDAPVHGKKSSSDSDGRLIVGFDANVGYSPRQGENAIAAAASLPTGLALQSGSVRIMPFLTPGLAYGRLNNVAYEGDDAPTSYGAITFMIGGGVGLQFGTSGVGANLGFQRVMKSQGGATQLGIGMTWSGVTSAVR